MARCYAGTVMLEGTTLSEGRGTTRPLELFGAPDLDARALAARDAASRAGVAARVAGCGLLVRADVSQARGQALRGPADPRRGPGATTTTRSGRGALLALAFKALRRLQPDYPLWRDFPYEYEHDRLAIDLINGSELLREWVDDPAATPADLDALAAPDEARMARRARTVPAVPVSDVPPRPAAISSSSAAVSTAPASRAMPPGAASRRAAVEQHDLASHTSSASTKLIHGGLRYLEHYDFGLVRKALQEREVLLAAAPHIMWPLRFVLPHDCAPAPGVDDPRGTLSVRPPRPAAQPAGVERRRPAHASCRRAARGQVPPRLRVLRRLGRRFAPRRAECGRCARARRATC